MTLSQTIAAASAMDVSPRRAVMARLRFLMPRIKEMNSWLHVLRKRRKAAQSKRSRDGFEVLICMTERDLVPLQREAESLTSFINGKTKVKAGTPEFELLPEWKIEQALAVPIEDILDLKVKPKGTAKMICCPFHEDSSPSASINKHNVLICYAGCRPSNGKKGWNSIDLVMERDGVSFREAVLSLT